MLQQKVETPTASPRSRLMSALGRSYKTFDQVMVSTEIALNAHGNYPELTDLVNSLREADRRMKELLIAQSAKAYPVNIGGEEAYMSDTLDQSDSSASMVRRSQAKKLARRLYTLHHPDKGGDATAFNTVRRAANAGDLEVLAYFRVRDGIGSYTDEEIKTLTAKIEARYQLFCGRPSFAVAQAYYSNKEEYVKRYSELLKKRIADLQIQVTGYVANQEA